MYMLSYVIYSVRSRNAFENVSFCNKQAQVLALLSKSLSRDFAPVKRWKIVSILRQDSASVTYFILCMLTQLQRSQNRFANLAKQDPGRARENR